MLENTKFFLFCIWFHCDVSFRGWSDNGEDEIGKRCERKKETKEIKIEYEKF